MAATLEFPACVGPFTMQTVNVARAFNAFYRQHQFPKPDPESSENSMAGFDPLQAGIPGQEIKFCQLSPLHRITLDEETKVIASIPKDAKYFAWVYPMVKDETGGPSNPFLDYGGYIYFNDQRDAVGTNAIVPAPLGTLGLMFGRAHILPPNLADMLTRQGRFQEITLEPLSRAGASHFAWVRPQEFSKDMFCADGCFAYKFTNGPAKYYPVVKEPVFTPALLEETLEDSEAWVVVRQRDPRMEVAVIFDKTKTLEQNLDINKQQVAVIGAIAEAVVGKDSQAGLNMSYEDWQQSDGAGSLGDPWIIHLKVL